MWFTLAFGIWVSLQIQKAFSPCPTGGVSGRRFCCSPLPNRRDKKSGAVAQEVPMGHGVPGWPEGQAVPSTHSRQRRAGQILERRCYMFVLCRPLLGWWQLGFVLAKLSGWGDEESCFNALSLPGWSGSSAAAQGCILGATAKALATPSRWYARSDSHYTKLEENLLLLTWLNPCKIGVRRDKTLNTVQISASGKGCRDIAGRPEKAHPGSSPDPLTPPWVSGPETQRLSEFSEGWQFAHTARIWCLLKGKNSTAGRRSRLLLEESLSVPHTLQHTAFWEERKKDKIRTSAASERIAGKVGPYAMCRHRKLWVTWAIQWVCGFHYFS